MTSTLSAPNLLPSSSSWSSALPSSKSFSLCGWPDHRRKTSSPAALIWRLGVDFPRTRLQPKDPTQPCIYLEQPCSRGDPPLCARLENVLFFYLPSSNRVLNCIYVAVQTKKPWDIYENYKSVSR